jgi:hypothetical protein
MECAAQRHFALRSSPKKMVVAVARAPGGTTKLDADPCSECTVTISPLTAYSAERVAPSNSMEKEVWGVLVIEIF